MCVMAELSSSLMGASFSGLVAFMERSEMFLLFSALFQIAVACQAFRLARRYGLQRAGWSLFVAFIIMGVLRVLESWDDSSIPLLGADAPLVYLIVSLLLCIGMLHLETILRERIKMAEALRLNEEQCRCLIENIHHAAVFLLNPSGQVENWNAGAERLTGYTAQDVQQPDFSFLYTDRDLKLIPTSELVQTASSDERAVARGWSQRKDGTRFWSEVALSAIRDSGKLRGFTVVIHDLRKVREDEIRTIAFSELGHRLSSARSPRDAAEVIMDIADQLIGWNACLFTLYSPEEKLFTPVLVRDLVNGTRKDILLNDYEPQSHPMTCRAVSEGAQLILRTPPLAMPRNAKAFGDVSRPSASLMFVPLRNGQRVVGVLSLQSYTFNAYSENSLQTLQALADHAGAALERISMEEALHESEKRFRGLFENSPDAIFVEDLDGTVLDVNLAACRLHEWRREDLIGKNLLDLVPPERKDEAACQFRRMISSECVQTQSVSWTADGKVIPVEIRVSRTMYFGKSALLLNVRDLRDRQKLEMELCHAQKMLTIGQLAAGVAHDFNNILTIIQGYANLLLHTDDLPRQTREALSQISGATQRAAGLSRQLLAFGKKDTMRFEPVNLNGLISEMAKILRRVIGENVELHLNYMPRLPMTLGDSGMIEQVLLNFAINARDAMPRGGRIVIETSAVEIKDPRLNQSAEARAGNFVRVTVQDTGEGIPTEVLPRLFEPFFTTKPNGKGTGLGLATAQRIVKQHNGWIEVQSTLNRGTTFLIYLPATAGYCSLGDHVNAFEPNRGGGKETILIVEDEMQVRTVVRNALMQHGFHVIEAASATVALGIWKQHREEIDLVMTDVIMPGNMSGLELAKLLRSEKPTTRLVFTSGYSPEILSGEFPLEEGHNFVPKPYSIEDLIRIIRKSLDTPAGVAI
jgi:two-component system, cell cycle sensor histidine kinase and response regulator CckA